MERSDRKDRTKAAQESVIAAREALTEPGSDDRSAQEVVQQAFLVGGDLGDAETPQPQEESESP